MLISHDRAQKRMGENGARFIFLDFQTSIEFDDGMIKFQ